MGKSIRLAFSGSGFLIAAHAGAACAAIAEGYSIIEVAGTSGGSIIAAAIARGMTAGEIHKLAVTTDYRPLLGLSWATLLSLKAYCSGEALQSWLYETLGDGTIAETVIPFTAIATDLNSGEPYCMDAELNGDMPIALACRASAAVPFVYEPLRYQGQVLVDGGASNNLPEQYLVQQGLRVAVDLDSGNSNAVNTPLQIAGACINTLLATNEDARIALAQKMGAKVLRVDVRGFGFLDTDLTQSEKQTLFMRGYHAMKELL